MFSTRLQNLQWLGGVAVAACCLLLGGGALISSLKDYRAFDEGYRQIERFHGVMAAVDSISAERGPANNAMTAPPDLAPGISQELEARRAQTDRLIGEAERLFDRSEAQTGLRGSAMDEVRGKLAIGRRAVDAIRVAPVSERSGWRIAGAIEAMFAVADAGETVRDQLGRAIIQKAPQVGAETFLSMSASSLREYGGRFGSYVVMILTSPEQDHARLRVGMSETLGRLKELRRVLSNYADGYFPNGPVELALKEVEQRYFLAGLPSAAALAERGATAQASPIAFTRSYAPVLKTAEVLREEIAAASREKFRALRDQAFVRLLFAVGLMFAACIILSGISLLFSRTLFHPLLSVRDQVVAIARGDLSEPRSLNRVSHEIQDMVSGLDVLRDQQRHRVELERDQKIMAQQLLRLSQTDALTQLLNRRAIEGLGEHEFARADELGQAVGLVMFDVDRFKLINDGYGHVVGDLVLKRLAEELTPKLRPGDVFARFGGEEFVVMLPNVREDEAVTVAERLRAALAGMVVDPSHEFRVTGSFGVGLRPPGANIAWDRLVAIADRRLYAAKAAGRNCVVSRDASAASAA